MQPRICSTLETWMAQRLGTNVQWHTYKQRTFRSCQLAEEGRPNTVALKPVPLPSKVLGTGGGGLSPRGPLSPLSDPRDNSTLMRFPPNSYPSLDSGVLAGGVSICSFKKMHACMHPVVLSRPCLTRVITPP